jgi:hypothetical protein
LSKSRGRKWGRRRKKKRNRRMWGGEGSGKGSPIWAIVSIEFNLNNLIYSLLHEQLLAIVIPDEGI